MLRSVGKQSGESVESVRKKKRKAAVDRSSGTLLGEQRHDGCEQFA